jgi:SAM-dependent methyltransferase
MDDLRRVQQHYAPIVDSYTREYRDDYPGYPANRKRLGILVDRMTRAGVKSALDCGCGEGSPMMGMAAAGIDVWGFDFVAEMAASARERLGTRGMAGHVWQGSIMELKDFRPAPEVPAVFDCCIAMGVFPHLSDELAALRNMAAVVRPGGRVMVEFRNELFALFTANRYSLQFMMEQLIRVGEASARHPEFAASLAAVEKALTPLFRTDMPPLRRGTKDAPGYDEILARFHNPLSIGASLFAPAGLTVDAVHFYHYHAVPPMLESADPKMFRTLSVEMEADPRDWRGHFMASAFVVEAVKG